MSPASPPADSQPVLRRASTADAPAIRRMIQALILHSGNPPATPAPAEELARHMSGAHPDIEGVIAERGTHKELLENRGIYEKLFSIQVRV